MSKTKPERERYQPIKPSIWNDPDFRNYKDPLKLLWFYLLTSPHSNMIGLYRLPVQYAIYDLVWAADDYNERFGKLLDQTKIQFDPATDLVLVMNHLKHRPLDNPNQVTKAIGIVDAMPNTPLFAGFLECVKRYPKPFYKPLEERLGKRLQKGLGKPVSVPVPAPVSETVPEEEGKNLKSDETEKPKSETEKGSGETKPAKKTYGPAVDAYRDVFKLTPSPEQREWITKTVGSKIEAWGAVLLWWKANKHSPMNIADMLSRLEKQNGGKPIKRTSVNGSGSAWESEISKTGGRAN